MDEAKQRKLIEIGYSIRACGLCKHADIGPGTDWGTCEMHRYLHGKHTGDERQLSINRHGVCPSFAKAATAGTVLQGFATFLGGVR